jgi:hypothetical protein
MILWGLLFSYLAPSYNPYVGNKKGDIREKRSLVKKIFRDISLLPWSGPKLAGDFY